MFETTGALLKWKQQLVSYEWQNTQLNRTELAMLEEKTDF